MLQKIYEFDKSSMTNARVDKGNRIINGVSIVSTNTSKNGRLYEKKAFESLVTIINEEQSKCFLNHKSNMKKTSTDSVRDLRDFVGSFHNAHTDGKSTVKADLKCVNQHWNLIADLAESNAPVGMSIAVSAHCVKKDGHDVVEDIGKIYSVDCVSSPAMTNRILESIQGNNGLFDIDEAVEIFLGADRIDHSLIDTFLKTKRR